MLSKYTLSFLYKEQQENYMKRNSPKIIQEHLNFTIYALTFAIVNTVLFIISQSIAYSILAASSCILILFLQRLIQLKPNYIDYVITFYQFYVLFIIEINNMLSIEDQASRAFAWSYGYQTCFMHFSLYLQATDMLSSTLVLLIVTSTHLAFMAFDPIYSITNIFSFLFLFMCMIKIKYNYERRKKEEFFYSYQQEQWELIIRKSMSNSMILIRYDDKQDQLRLVKQSIKSQNTHGIKNCYDMRQFLRNLVEIIPGQNIRVSKFRLGNLEQLVRQNLVKNEKLQHCPQEKKHFIDQVNRVIYKVKLNKFILNNELMSLLILDRIQIPDNKFQDMQIILFSQLSERMAFKVKQQLECQVRQQMQNNNNIQQIQKRIRQNFYLQTTLFFVQLLTKNLLNKVNIINQAQLSSQLNQIFGSKCHVKCQTQFTQQLKYIISLIVTCCKLIEHLNEKLPIFDVEFHSNEQQQINMTLIFPFNLKEQHKSNIQLLSANWIGSNRGQFNRESLYENCIGRLCHLSSQYHLPTLMIFDICVMQIIMSNICLFNHFKVEINQSDVILLCTFYKI